MDRNMWKLLSLTFKFLNSWLFSFLLHTSWMIPELISYTHSQQSSACKQLFNLAKYFYEAINIVLTCWVSLWCDHRDVSNSCVKCCCEDVTIYVNRLIEIVTCDTLNGAWSIKKLKVETNPLKSFTTKSKICPLA